MIRLPERLVERLLVIGLRREPDFIIGEPGDPYMRRWWLIPRNRFLNVYLHHFLRSDDDRALHDHPWHSLSFLLRGDMIEWTHAERNGRKLRQPRGEDVMEFLPGEPGNFAPESFWRRVLCEGAITFRTARHAHRIELVQGIVWHDDAGQWQPAPLPAWTLFITGPRMRDWGFWCSKGWVPWQIFTSASDKGQIGRGCT